MKIRDLTETNLEFGPKYDVADDVCVFMRNEPMFYRKKTFPLIMKMKDCYDNGTKIDMKKTLFPIVDEAVKSYCKK